MWDLWETADVFARIVSPPRPMTGQSTAAARQFFTECVARGADIFGDSSDNMTGMVIYLNPKGTPSGSAGDAPKSRVVSGKDASTAPPPTTAPPNVTLATTLADELEDDECGC